jgi:anti-anti-sigma regulatory factor
VHGTSVTPRELPVVRPLGRLTVREGQELCAEVCELQRAGPRDVVVDLGAVTEISDYGFALLCGLAKRLADSGATLRFAHPRAFVRKYVDLFGTEGALPVEAARAGPRPPRPESAPGGPWTQRRPPPRRPGRGA